MLLFFFLSFCPFLIISLSLSHSTKKKFLKINDLCLKEKIFYPNTYLQNTLSEKDYKTYFKLKAFFDYLVRIGYYNNYLTSEEVGLIRKLEKERKAIFEEIKKATEPVEKEFWEMKLKNFEKENSKYLNLKGDKEYA